MDFDALNQEDVTVEIITLSGHEKVQATEGMTIREFKEKNNLVGTKLIDENSDVLRDSDTVRDGMQVFLSAPKKNG